MGRSLGITLGFSQGNQHTYKLRFHCTSLYKKSSSESDRCHTDNMLYTCMEQKHRVVYKCFNPDR